MKERIRINHDIDTDLLQELNSMKKQDDSFVRTNFINDAIREKLDRIKPSK
jgi:metal-responsive CopG/Arc/MetJ family transcriptional regulator